MVTINYVVHMHIHILIFIENCSYVRNVSHISSSHQFTYGSLTAVNILLVVS